METKILKPIQGDIDTVVGYTVIPDIHLAEESHNTARIWIFQKANDAQLFQSYMKPDHTIACVSMMEDLQSGTGKYLADTNNGMSSWIHAPLYFGRDIQVTGVLR